MQSVIDRISYLLQAVTDRFTYRSMTSWLGVLIVGCGLVVILILARNPSLAAIATPSYYETTFLISPSLLMSP